MGDERFVRESATVANQNRKATTNTFQSQRSSTAEAKDEKGMTLQQKADLENRLNILSNAEQGIILNDRIKRKLLSTATTSQTDKTRTTQKTVPSFDMRKAPVKYSIFEAMAGPNERRFIAFNDMPMISSKYEREQVGIVDFTYQEGRAQVPSLNPEPHEMMPDYTTNVEYFKKNLRQGAVKFGSMSSRKPNINKNYSLDRTFYTQQSNTATIEFRPIIRKNKLF